MTTAVAIVSGGMDSVTLAHLIKRHDPEARLIIVSFDYGQRHQIELDYARYQARILESEHKIVDLRSMSIHLHGSSLTSSEVEVPDGHYSDESMKATVVPNRNMIMLSIAGGIAVAEGAQYVATAVHAGDHFIYPDCRPEFVEQAARTIKAATADGFGSWDDKHGVIWAPFINIGKHDIVSVGMGLGVNYHYTWSCYKGGDLHCGRCGTCVERKEAFQLANVVDPTNYDDPAYLVEANQ